MNQFENEYEYLMKKKGIDKREFPLAFSHGYTKYLENRLKDAEEKVKQLQSDNFYIDDKGNWQKYEE